MFSVMKAIDKASGYVFRSDDTLSSMMSTAVGTDFDFFKYVLFCEVYIHT